MEAKDPPSHCPKEPSWSYGRFDATFVGGINERAVGMSRKLLKCPPNLPFCAQKYNKRKQSDPMAAPETPNPCHKERPWWRRPCEHPFGGGLAQMEAGMTQTTQMARNLRFAS